MKIDYNLNARECGIGADVLCTRKEGGLVRGSGIELRGDNLILSRHILRARLPSVCKRRSHNLPGRPFHFA